MKNGGMRSISRLSAWKSWRRKAFRGSARILSIPARRWQTGLPRPRPLIWDCRSEPLSEQGLIDAHAGGVGTLGGDGADGRSKVQNRLAYVFGTSACSMASSDNPIFVGGVWGPYYSAMIPGLWLTEGGQSAAGAAIDHLVTMHPASAEARAKAEMAGLSLVAWLDRQATEMCPNLAGAVELAKSVHVVPEFLGNRSPPMPIPMPVRLSPASDLTLISPT